MLQAAPSSSSASTNAQRRGHAHKRSAAISGDFDLDFFKLNPSINEQLITNTPSTTTSCNFSTPDTPYTKNSTPASNEAPVLVITEPEKPSKVITSTPSPVKKHTRLNSWAQSLLKSKTSENTKSSQEYTSSSSSAASSPSSNERTPDLNRQSLRNYSYQDKTSSPHKKQQYRHSQNYEVPEAIIDLDLASGIYQDPSKAQKYKKKIQHRRTESAPELEDFLKHRVFSNHSNKNSRKNSAIFEEEEVEDNDEAISSTSSSTNLALNKNSSFNSLNSNTSSNSGSNQNTQPQVLSTPTSTKTTSTTTRRGASATRYQSYYNNNIMLSNALKSSESLSHVTNNNSSSINNSNNTTLHKTSISSFTNNRNFHFSSSSSINSSIPNSPSRFKFESQVYDIPQKQSTSSTTSNQSKNQSKNSIFNDTTKLPTVNLSSSPNKKVSKQHKKSKSLLNAISMKLRRNSSSSPSRESIRFDGDHDDIDDYEEGDSTITPSNLGEPGPELDLTTMTPKFYNDNNDNEKITIFAPDDNKNNGKKQKHTKTSFVNNDHTTTPNKLGRFKNHSSEDVKESPNKSKKPFFHWRKK